MDINTTTSTIKDLMNSKTGTIIQFIDFITFIWVVVRLFWRGIKKSTEFVKAKQNRKIIRDTLIIAIYTLIGLIIPLLTIISKWDLPSTGITLLLEILAWYVLVSFLIFILLFRWLLKILKTTTVID
ncbi:MAG: hypothetical protein K1X81_09290 [Bacteroidia bacterium]|nr:hypothetical protein [Bacteroidia bacterium]